MAKSVVRGIGRSLRGLRAGVSGLASQYAWVQRTPDCIVLRSASFGHGVDLPVRFTADGAHLFPALDWSGIPVGTASLALLVEDADAPLPIPLAHAVVYNVPPTLTGLPEAAIPTVQRDPASSGYVVGRNTLGAPGWLPPSPPRGHGPHHYAFQLFALDYRPSWDWPTGRGAVMRAMRGHLLGHGTLFGIYERA